MRGIESWEREGGKHGGGGDKERVRKGVKESGGSFASWNIFAVVCSWCCGPKQSFIRVGYIYY